MHPSAAIQAQPSPRDISTPHSAERNPKVPPEIRAVFAPEGFDKKPATPQTKRKIPNPINQRPQNFMPLGNSVKPVKNTRPIVVCKIQDLKFAPAYGCQFSVRFRFFFTGRDGRSPCRPPRENVFFSPFIRRVWPNRPTSGAPNSKTEKIRPWPMEKPVSPSADGLARWQCHDLHTMRRMG